MSAQARKDTLILQCIGTCSLTRKLSFESVLDNAHCHAHLDIIAGLHPLNTSLQDGSRTSKRITHADRNTILNPQARVNGRPHGYPSKNREESPASPDRSRTHKSRKRRQVQQNTRSDTILRSVCNWIEVLYQSKLQTFAPRSNRQVVRTLNHAWMQRPSQPLPDDPAHFAAETYPPPLCVLHWAHWHIPSSCPLACSPLIEPTAPRFDSPTLQHKSLPTDTFD
ncbi:hypothetical protein BT96DRAFT_1008520 [Gymnopus androsaceus JB14]|uniref:Uncharacterized protein n=1 Tax=Gymnopus androsaceus JB14 TaxID=1447944 RepID=A0A6A4GEQ1_9AGAR|nr:hypothetical protein BT96DRAFT_1008520 [Gymnopus androsaceus JB14]